MSQDIQTKPFSLIDFIIDLASCEFETRLKSGDTGVAISVHDLRVLLLKHFDVNVIAADDIYGSLHSLAERYTNQELIKVLKDYLKGCGVREL